MARRPTIRVRGLDEFEAALSRLPARLRRTEGEWGREAAERLAEAGRGAAGGRLAPAVRPSVRRGRGEVRLVAAGAYSDALVRFVGARRRTGWYAAARYAGSTPQHPRWLGQDWDIADLYRIGPAMAGAIDDVVDVVGDHYERQARRAFPD